LAVLLECRLAQVDQDRSSEGRPTERWCYTGNEINEIDEIASGQGGDEGGDTSFNSSISSAREPHEAVLVHSDFTWRDPEEGEPR
jgi:hypothetical protein